MEIPRDDGEIPVRRPKPVPGTYTFNVRVASVSYHNDGTPILLLECDCKENGWKLFERLYFTEKARWFSKQKLKGLGVPDGLHKVEPWMFLGTRFRAVCDVEKSKPNAQGKQYDNLRIDVGERDGFFCGVQLLERGPNMPMSAESAPRDGDELAQTGPAGSDDVPF